MMPRTPTSKLSIPRDLMDYWQHWRSNHGYTPNLSHVALYIFTRLSADDRYRALQICNAEYRDGGLESVPETAVLLSSKMLSGLPQLYGAWFKTLGRYNCDDWHDIVVYTSARGAYDAAKQSQQSKGNRRENSRSWGEIIVVELKPQALFGLSDRADLPSIAGRIGPDGRDQRLVNMAL